MDEIDSLNIISRHFKAFSDQAFVYATWRNSVFYSKPTADRTRPKRQGYKEANEEFKRLTHEIKQILDNATVIVACLEESPDVIVGYVVFTRSNLDWVYVKEDYRKQGVASLLIPKHIITVSPPQTKIGLSILRKRLKEETKGEDSGSQEGIT